MAYPFLRKIGVFINARIRRLHSPSPRFSYSSPVLLHDRYLINPGTPLGDLDSPSAKAYLAEDRHDLGRKLFALICTPGLPPRTNVMAVLKGNHIDGLLPLVEWDTIDWPPLGERSMVVIHELPLGGRVMDAYERDGVKISEFDMPKKVLEPLSEALQQLSGHKITHRAVRADNFFYMDKERNSVVLGECVTAPPGADNPPIFETIERSMASLGGRGKGELTDDLYALAVSIVFIVQGSNPVSNLSEEELINSRVVQGTYGTLSTGSRIPMSLLEPLRGLLSDTLDERWTMEELEMWLDGQRLTPLQKKAKPKLENPFTFSGHDHVTTRTLARAMALNVGEAAKVVKDGQLESWLRRYLKEEFMANKVKETAELAEIHKTEVQGMDDYVVAKACIILDPTSPIRFKGISFMPEAFGTAMAVELLRRGDAQIAAETVLRGIPGIWMGAQKGVRQESSPFSKTFNPNCPVPGPRRAPSGRRHRARAPATPRRPSHRR